MHHNVVGIVAHAHVDTVHGLDHLPVDAAGHYSYLLPKLPAPGRGALDHLQLPFDRAELIQHGQGNLLRCFVHASLGADAVFLGKEIELLHIADGIIGSLSVGAL